MKLLAAIFFIATVVVSVSGPIWAFIPSTLFAESVSPTINFSPSNKAFTYSYEVSNLRSSTQSIGDFGVEYNQYDISNLNVPDGWISFPTFEGRNVLMIGTQDSRSVHPGSSLGGFRFSSKMLPTIVNFYSKSTYTYIPSDPYEEEELSTSGSTDYFNNCKTNKTVGPGPSQISNSSDLVAYIIQEKERCFGLGWITSQGVKSSLDSKLNAIMESISRGNLDSARNKAGAFLNELNAQRDKAVNQSAYTLLQANVSYLVMLLGQ